MFMHCKYAIPKRKKKQDILHMHIFLKLVKNKERTNVMIIVRARGVSSDDTSFFKALGLASCYYYQKPAIQPLPFP